MKNQLGTLEILAKNLAIALNPIGEAIQSSEALQDFFERLGWQIPDSIPSIGLDINKTETLNNALDNALELDLETADKSQIASAYSLVLAAVVAQVKHIYDISVNIESNLGSAFVTASQIAQELPKRMIDYLIINYLKEYHSTTYLILITLGIAELEKIAKDDSKFISEHTRYIIHYNQIGKLFTDPSGLFKEVYKWGDPSANLNLMLERINELALNLGIPTSLNYPEIDKEKKISSPAIIQEGEAENLELRIPIVYTDDYADAEAGITILQIPPLAPGSEPGLALCPYATGTIEEDFPIDSKGLWKISVSTTLDLVVGIGLIFRPNELLRILTDIFESCTSASGRMSATLARSCFENEKIAIIGTSNGTGLTAKTINGNIEIVIGAGHDADFIVEFNLIDGRIRIILDSIDSFLESGLPLDPIDIEFDFGIGWSSRKGVYFTGGAGLEYSLAIHRQLGPFKLDILHLGFKFLNGNLKLMIALTGGMLIGPLCAIVEQVGLVLVADLQSGNGNLGVIDLSPAFKPPSGIALSLDAGPVKGAGYLFIDADKDEYAGALELTFQDFLSLKAIGLINTKMPDGSKGFSMLIIITAEFTIQIGMGFVFLGAGGLLGLHRTAKLEPLAEGVRSGATANILFPINVVENAPKIISDIKLFFPIQQNHFLIGPMIKLGYGQPALISLALGIIIEIKTDEGGGIERIAILGVLKCILPEEKAAILVLQVNFIGAVDFTTKYGFFFASVFESRILTFTIEGEMGVLVAWGENSDFLVSVGGFHPSFNPPPLPFPIPKRMALSILNESWGKIRVEGYFAITTNTVQFGAKIEVYFGISDFCIDGHLAFDALFQFDPFYFIVEISGKVSLKVCGAGLFSVTLNLSLEGPTPWRAKGKGKIKVLFFSFTASFDKRWGNEQDTALPPIEVISLLLNEFRKSQNWQAVAPVSGGLLVSLRKLPENTGQESDTGYLVLHPIGNIKVSQRAVPLKITIDKVGNQRPSGGNNFTLNLINDEETLDLLEYAGDTQESFAPAQFFEMNNSKKLSEPATRKYNSGIFIRPKGSGAETHYSTTRHNRYELITIDSGYKRTSPKLVRPNPKLFEAFIRNNAATKSVLSNKYKSQSQPFDEKIKVKEGCYTVAYTSNNKAYNNQSSNFASTWEAEAFINKNNKDNAALHVIPVNEVNEYAL